MRCVREAVVRACRGRGRAGSSLRAGSWSSLRAWHLSRGSTGLLVKDRADLQGEQADQRRKGSDKTQVEER